MKKTKKSLTTIASLIPLAGVCFVPALASCSNNKTSIVHILEADDIHGEIPGYGDDFFSSSSIYAGAMRVADEMQKIVEQYPGSICLSGGDNNSSGTFSTCTKGETMYPVLGAMDFRYSVVGNHAWDWGKEALETYKYDYLGRTPNTEGNYFVTGNVLDGAQFRQKTWCADESSLSFKSDYEIWKKNKVEWADPAKIVDMNGHNVCLIGLTTTIAMRDGNKEELKDTTIVPYLPSIHYIKHYIQEELPEAYDKIDAFVLYTHCGHSEVETLIKDLDTNIDLVLCAHTHSDASDKAHSDILDKDIPYVESQAHFASFSDAELVFDDSKPIGSRLIDVNTKNITPFIDYGGHDPKEEPEEAKAAAAAQLANIEAQATNQVVINTCRVYNEQKQIAKTKLATVLGHSNNGLAYEQLGKQYDKPATYPTDAHLIEQVGAWLCKSEVLGFNKLYEKEIADGEMLPVSIAYCTNDSINTTVASNSDVLFRDVYGFFPFDNTPVYGVLTYDQLLQIIRYTLSGANDSEGEHYYYREKIRNKSTDEGETMDELRVPYGQNQLYGMSFGVKKLTTPDSSARLYDYDSTVAPLKIFDAVNHTELNDIDNPENYEGLEYWGLDGQNHYIPIVLSNFNYNGGNNQQKMIKQFCEYNAKQNPNNPELQVHEFPGMDLRQLMLTYLELIQHETSVSVDMPIDLLKDLFPRIDA